MHQAINTHHVTRLIFISLLGGLALYNSIQTILKLIEIYPHRKPNASFFIGKKFESFAPILAGSKYVAYYTDQNIDDPRPLMELQQAQFILAPVILDPDSLNHRYIIINCANIPEAIARMQAVGAKPVAVNRLGIILAERTAHP